MATLHLIRHAAVTIDPEVPSADWQVTPDADAAVRQLVSTHNLPHCERVFSSPQPKAVATAKVLANELDAKVEIREGLEEHHRKNEAFIESEAEFLSRLEQFFQHSGTLVFGSETAKASLLRFHRTVAAIMAERGQTEIIVTHGTVMSLFLGKLGGDAFEIWKTLSTPDYRFVNWED